MQHIVIKNNGPVRDFEMDINKYNVLIGEQATGKSTVAKSIYYSRYIKTLITNFLIQVMERGTYSDEKVTSSKLFYKYIGHKLKDTFIQLFGYSWELDPDFKIRYSFGEDIWFENVLASGNRSSEKKYIKPNYSPTLSNEINMLQREALAMFEETKRAHLSLDLEREIKSRNREYIQHRVNEIFKDDLTTYYVPAGRSMLTLLSANPTTMNSLQGLDLVMKRFQELIEGVRGVYRDGVTSAFKYFPRGDRNFNVHEISSQIIEMLKGEYRNDPFGEILRVHSGEDNYEDIKINFASSGQQEIIWLLNFLYVLMLRGENAFVIIEEPEAHIYPSLQKKIIDFIIQFAHICNGNAFVTTHSPYVLMTMNNAYYAGCVATNNNVDVSSVIKPLYRIEKGTLTAMKLKDAPKESVVDLLSDEDEISSYLIDEISSEINETYTNLFMLNEKETDNQ